MGQLIEERKVCLTILKKLMHHKYGWVFNEPVDTVKLCIPDYHLIIKNPMDFDTIKKKLESFHYSNLEEFVYDVRLTFLNAITYNPIDHDVYKMAQTLSSFFENQWNKMIINNPFNGKPELKKSKSKVKFCINVLIHSFI